MITPTFTGMNLYHQPATEIDADKQFVLNALDNMNAFSSLYEKYYENILRFVYQRVNTKEEACDVTQQVFLQAMSNLKKYSFRGLPFSSWLYRIAINEMNSMSRKNKIKQCINIDEINLRKLADEMSDETDEVKNKLLVTSLSSLPLDEFELIQMRFFEKRSFAEIGEILSITENNSKVKTYRILEKLKKIMSGKF